MLKFCLLTDGLCADGSGRYTIPGVGQEKVTCKDCMLKFCLLTDGMLTKWTGKLPSDWFMYNGYEDIERISGMISSNILPMVGETGTILWFSPVCEKVNKRLVVWKVHEIIDAVWEINPTSLVYFTMSIPVTGEHSMNVMNFNKNLLTAVRKARREGNAKFIRTVALHHWCLQQNKCWSDVGVPNLERSFVGLGGVDDS